MFSKRQAKYYPSDDEVFEWLNHLSQGGATYPKEWMINQDRILIVLANRVKNLEKQVHAHNCNQ
jgi:hypothetical protein